MDQCNKIVPPHLNAEVYRTDTTGTSSFAYLEYIRIHADGTVFIGCSELTGRYWTGAASLFKSVGEAKNVNETNKDLWLTSGTADGCFMENSDKVIICEDNGSMSIFSKKNQEDNAWSMRVKEMSVAEHDDSIMAIDCLEPGFEYVTVGADGNAKIWDVKETTCVRNYKAAHSKQIYGVSVRPKSTTTFATASMDEYMSLWDENIDKAVLDITKNDCSIRCLQWVDENKLLFGDEAGMLYSVDIRYVDSTLKLFEFPAAVHKIFLNPENDKVAVCCDNTTLTVCNIPVDDKAKIIYRNNSHTNLVRGVAWDTNERKLHSVGWDGTVKSHNLPSD